MKSLQTQVGSWKLNWNKAPRGKEGTAEIETQTGEHFQIQWKKDCEGIWILFPGKVAGFDLVAELDENGSPVFQVTQRIRDTAEWNKVSFFLGDQQTSGSGKTGKSKGPRIRSQMPGKIIRILAKAGQSVKKDEPLIVMEAMKMENEIRAPQAGKIKEIKITEGQAIESGVDLVILEGEPA